jgi:CIC family chloride channel protein
MNLFGLQISESNFALVGMAGMMAGIIHAPLTAIFLIAEITGGYQLFFPLMIVATISFATVRFFTPNSVYTIQLAKRGELLTHDKDRSVLLLMKVDRLIETDFHPIHPDATLGDLVRIIKKAHRNIFPVVDEEKNFHGLVKMDDIRDIMFNTDMYENTSVRDLMFMPRFTISKNESMEEVAKKFQISERYNIAVVDEGRYVGFVSRAKVFSAYRDILKKITPV